MGLILPQTVKVIITQQNRKHYELLGYRMGDEQTISVTDLPKGSETQVNVVCDFCGDVVSMSWKGYLHLKTSVYCCPKCITTKQKHIDEKGNLTFIDAKYRDREWLEAEYITKNRDAIDIANECHLNQRTLRWWISHFNLTQKNGSISNALPFEVIKQMYVELKMTTEEIGDKFCVSGNTIADLLKKNNVPIPSRSELMRVYFDEKGGREKFIEYGQRMENRIRISCKQRGLSVEEFDGFATTEQHMIRGSSDYDKWRSDVFVRDDYTCVCCGKRGGNLNAHHIQNFSKHTARRFDVDNGATMCEPCHSPKYPDSFHSIYGEKNNTRKQLEEYITARNSA